jgi:integrase
MIATLTYLPNCQNGNHEIIVLPDNYKHTGPAAPALPPSASPPPVVAPVQIGQPSRPTRSMTFRALAEQVKAESGHLATSTQKIRQSYLNMLSEHIDPNTDISSINAPLIRVVRGGLAQKCSASTVNDILNKGLGPILALAVELRMIEKSPLETLKALKKASPIRLQPTWEQAHAIIEDVEKSSPESSSLLKFMLYFGVGQAEIRGLRGEHVDLERPCVHFFRQKTRKEFIVPIYPYARELVEELKKKERLVPGKAVFTWRNPRKSLENACRNLKLPRYSPRSLRRTFIIHCLEKGVEARVVASWQGHADARLVLSTYGSFISADHAKDQAAKLG